LSQGKVIGCDGHKVLAEVDIDSAMIVGDTHAIFVQQVKLHGVHLLKELYTFIIKLIILLNYVIKCTIGEPKRGY
jgi:hypothetical protein